MPPHPSLKRSPANLIAGRWVDIPGDRVISTNPARPAETVWAGSPDIAQVDEAVAAAGAALDPWSAWPLDRRAAVLRAYQKLCRENAERLAGLIADETGKALWDARAEAGALAAKVDITLDDSEHGPLRRVLGYKIPLAPTRAGRCLFRPHGVMAVIAPYNFPAHLANGHIVPALAMGNTVVLKPSDKTPAVGQLVCELLQEALDAQGAPPGVVNLVQGGADIAQRLVAHDGVDGVLFTGSWPVGRRILEANLDRPGRIVALEMGGNNAAVVMPDADLHLAAIECVRSTFVTTGQRCTCTRRLIVHEEVADRLIPAICKAASGLIVGDPRAEHPVFMGPIISEQARAAVLDAQAEFARAGADILVQSTPAEQPGWYITPGVVRVDRFTLDVPRTGATALRAGSAADGPSKSDPGCDVEVFGPLLRIAVVGSLDEAIEQANATCFGLAASIFTRDQAAIDTFFRRVRAGCINANTGTAGASSKLPFGGLGLSGNHRPAGSFSLDYCAYPVAGMIETGPAPEPPPGMAFDEGWLR